MNSENTEAQFLSDIAENDPSTKPAQASARDYIFTDEDEMVAELNERIAIVPVESEIKIAFTEPGQQIVLRRKKDAELALQQYQVVTISRDAKGKQKEKLLPAFSAWLKHPDRREYTGIEFNPDVRRASPNKLNLWQGFAIEPSQGTYPLFAEHLAQNICQGEPELLRFMMGILAQMMQEPGRKLGIATVLIGDIGTGKSKVSEWIGKIIGPRYSPVLDKATQLTGQFRGQLETALLIRLEEATKPIAESDISTLKHIITSTELLFEKKGVDAYAAQNYSRIFITSNCEHPVPAVPGERRFFVLRVGKKQTEGPSILRSGRQGDGARRCGCFSL